MTNSVSHRKENMERDMRTTRVVVALLVLAFLLVTPVANSQGFPTQEELDDWVDSNCAISGQGDWETTPSLNSAGQAILLLRTESAGSAAALSCWSDLGPPSVEFQYMASMASSATGSLMVFHPGQNPCQLGFDLEDTDASWEIRNIEIGCEAGREVGFLLLHGLDGGSNEIIWNLESFEEFWDVFSGEIVVANEGPVTGFPTEFALGSAYPNPFATSTTIPFSLSAEGEVALTVYDVLGRVVSTTSLGSSTAGRHEIVFNAEGLAPGVYTYRLRVGDDVLSGRVVHVR